jgi:hypothetical protein
MSCEPNEKLTNQPTQPLRRFIMLTIKDLAVSKSLDSKEMAAISGGSAGANVSSVAFNQAFNQNGKGSLVNTQSAFSIPTTTVVSLENVGNTKVNPGYGHEYGYEPKMYA